MAELHSIDDEKIIEHDTDSEDDSYSELEKVLSSIAGDDRYSVSVKLYRHRNGKRHWLFDKLPDEMGDVLQILRDDYDGGQFESWVYQGNKLVTRKTFFVEPPKKKQEVRQPSNDTTLIIEGLKGVTEGINTLGQMLLQMNSQQSHQPQQPQMSEMERMTQMLSLMTMMKDVLGGQPAPQNDMNVFLKGVEFAKEIAGETLGDKSDPSPGQVLMSLGDKLAPVIGELVKQNGQKIPTQTQRQLTPQQMAILNEKKRKAAEATRAAANNPPSHSVSMDWRKAASQQPQPVQENDPMNLMKMMMKPQVSALVEYAKKGALPSTMAPEVLNAVPDMYYDTFGDFIFADDCLTQMIDINPEVSNYSGWFTDLRADIMILMEGGSEDEFDDEPLTDEISPANIGETEIPIEGDIIHHDEDHGAINGNS